MKWRNISILQPRQKLLWTALAYKYKYLSFPIISLRNSHYNTPPPSSPRSLLKAYKLVRWKLRDIQCWTKLDGGVYKDANMYTWTVILSSLQLIVQDSCICQEAVFVGVRDGGGTIIFKSGILYLNIGQIIVKNRASVLTFFTVGQVPPLSHPPPPLPHPRYSFLVEVCSLWCEKSATTEPIRNHSYWTSCSLEVDWPQLHYKWG
jgi:hypothetical protein